jgi:hypothetical protein
VAWWENRFLRVKDGKLYLGRREAAKIAAEHGTPIKFGIEEKEILMPIPKAGDVLAVLNTGTYARTMASNYNLRPIPKEIII